MILIFTNLLSYINLHALMAYDETLPSKVLCMSSDRYHAGVYLSN